MDIVKEGGIGALRITPEAGTVKGAAFQSMSTSSRKASYRFVAEHKVGPLLYKPDKTPATDDLIKRKKPRYAQARQPLATWVRAMGVTDPNISPNHA
jgi:hypothetical protein